MGVENRFRTSIWIPVSFLFSIGVANAQDNKPFYEFGLNLGRMVYQGDLTPSMFGSFKTSRTSIGVTVARVLGNSFSIRGSFLHGGLAGNDAAYSKPAYRKERAFRFSSPVNELSAQLVWSYPGVAQYEKGFSPYVFLGAGISQMNIKPDATSFNAEFFGVETAQIQAGLAADADHGTPAILPIGLAGVGFKYFFTPQWGANAEASYRITYSDYLDGFSQSVNPELNDHYMNYSVGVVYRNARKGVSLDCPRVSF